MAADYAVGSIRPTEFIFVLFAAIINAI